MSRFGNGSNSNGQFWFGGNTFPGFLYKKNVGVGGRRTTKFAPGGNLNCNTKQYIYNKYKPGQSGVGAQSIANRRAKNRNATICSSHNCFQCYMSLGQYSKFTHNPNGIYPCLSLTNSTNIPIPIKCDYYPLDAYFPTFRGNYPNSYGHSSFDGSYTLTQKYSSSGLGIIDISGSTPVIDKNGFIYVCSSSTATLYCYNPDCSLKWTFVTGGTSDGTTYSYPIIGCDGTIYFTCSMGSDLSSLFAINPNGTQKWVVNSLDGNMNVTYPLIINDANIFVSTSNGYIYIINNGIILQTIYLGAINLNGWNSCYDSTINCVFINTGNNDLYKINMSDYTYISANMASSGLFSAPTVINNSVYQPTSNGQIYKYNKSNLTLVDSSAPLGSGVDDNSLMVDKNGYLYIGSGGNFIKLDQNLNQIWAFSVFGEDFNAGSATISRNGYIYVNGYNNGLIYCLNTNGTLVSNAPYIDKYSYGSPTVGKNGLVYINTAKGLIAYGNL